MNAAGRVNRPSDDQRSADRFEQPGQSANRQRCRGRSARRRRRRTSRGRASGTGIRRRCEGCPAHSGAHLASADASPRVAKPVEAPRSAAGCREVEEEERIQQDRIAAVAMREHGPPPAAGQRRRGWRTSPPSTRPTCRVKRPSIISSPAGKRQQLEDAVEGHPRGSAGFRKAEHLLHAMPEHQEAENDSRDALQVRRQPGAHFFWPCMPMIFLYSCASVAEQIISMRSVLPGMSLSGSLLRPTHGLVYTFGSSIVTVSSSGAAVHAVVALLDAHVGAVRVAGVVEPRSARPSRSSARRTCSRPPTGRPSSRTTAGRDPWAAARPSVQMTRKRFSNMYSISTWLGVCTT